MNTLCIGETSMAIVAEVHKTIEVKVMVVGVTVTHRQYKTRKGNYKSTVDVDYTVECVGEQMDDGTARYTINHTDLR